MQSQQCLPDAGLRPWIHSYRRYHFEQGDPEVLTLLPGTGAELWLGEGGGSALLCPRHRVQQLARPARPVFAIRFRAGALPLFGVPALSGLVDRETPARQLWPEDADAWARLGGADFETQCGQASLLLLSRLRETPELERMRSLAGRMFADSAGFALGVYADEANVDRCGLSRRFHASQGVTAKFYHRLCRFERFLRDAVFQSRPSLAGLAWEHGYFDQAHLHRDARSLVGLPPARLLSEPAWSLFYSPLAVQPNSSPERWPSSG
ncbi:helix-turn-helix domain-containing protein [Chromobacterium sp. IIBBL 290-4]|uniref:AraC family transcriptional regulator n=1 Tax=Chromobacterium sp. IIBBL 290-4 TaxID=2953890 RepID=UPI0020B8E5CC|nr:helix-turn-helix domain-containing protein [Chromobacterium sp. IIBBL 290-4]UTH75945.1 helix-turn-helix domain-containing protein [Chromobacterium sp. IIBBL 290-4]